MEKCYRHPTRETGVSCSSCGRPICPDCMTPTPVGMRCPECSRQKTQVRTIDSVRGGVEVTRILIGINVIAWIGELASSGTNGSIFAHGALFGPAIALNHEYWRLITGGFLHYPTLGLGLFHIGFNMYLLWILGNMLEPSLGSVRFAALYFTALLAGSFGALVLNFNATTVGASGAVFGLMGAAFVDLRARGIDPFQAGIGGLIVINLVLSFALSNISIGGHIGGLIGGGLAMMAIQAGDRQRSRALGLGVCAVIGVAAVVASIALAHSKLTV
jgi:membrane associated rhomboid family serine protease